VNHNILLHTRRLLLLEQQGLPFPVGASCRKWGGGGVRSATVQLEQVVVGKPVVAHLTHEDWRTLLLIIRITIEEFRKNKPGFLCCGSGCLSRIRIFSIPNPSFIDPGSASKNLSILTQKMVSKLSEI
jgi:hypothetical protein